MDARDAARTIVVKMAEMAAVSCDPEHAVVLKTTLGSCVGVILADKNKTIAGLAHIMLPKRIANDEALGKYADTALPALLARMKEQRLSGTLQLEAWVIGGACMFQMDGGASINDIGNRNIEAVLKTIEKLNIPVVYRDTGGKHGRTVIYDCRSGEVTVRSLKKFEAHQKDRTDG
ncbi:MAG: chemotaxis protein CheD [Spirochaetaceae bacterium]|nr:MAG: chemotaxis protein CheD [Spirochaetaceae bacterium]